jgi:hypothetical protein
MEHRSALKLTDHPTLHFINIGGYLRFFENCKQFHDLHSPPITMRVNISRRKRLVGVSITYWLVNLRQGDHLKEAGADKGILLKWT